MEQAQEAGTAFGHDATAGDVAADSGAVAGAWEAAAAGKEAAAEGKTGSDLRSPLEVEHMTGVPVVAHAGRVSDPEEPVASVLAEAAAAGHA